MADSPYFWDNDKVVLNAGFHSFTLVYIEPMAQGRSYVSIYGWHPDSPHILPPQGEDRGPTDGDTDGAIEITCRNATEARAVVEALFRVRGFEIRGGSNG